MSNVLRWTPEQLDAYKARNRAGLTDAERQRGKEKRPKYGNKKVRLDTGEVVDSKKEAQRRHELGLMVAGGLIEQLRHSVPYAMVHNGVLICQYVADHVYYDRAKKCLVVEDTKSPATRRDKVYRLKVKMMLAFHGINVREV